MADKTKTRRLQDPKGGWAQRPTSEWRGLQHPIHGAHVSDGAINARWRRERHGWGGCAIWSSWFARSVAMGLDWAFAAWRLDAASQSDHFRSVNHFARLGGLSWQRIWRHAIKGTFPCHHWIDPIMILQLLKVWSNHVGKDWKDAFLPWSWKRFQRVAGRSW